MEELTGAMTAEEVDEVLSSTGRRLAAKWPLPRGELHTRVEAAVSVLNALGGLTELERRNGTYLIQGYSCPLAAGGPGPPGGCPPGASPLTEVGGVPGQECCNGSEATPGWFFLGGTLALPKT